MQRILFLILCIAIGTALTPLPLLGHPDDEPGALGAAKPVLDPAKGALFLNMINDDAWRGWLGLQFAYSTLLAGHPVTIFLNFDAVRLAAANQPPGADSRRPPDHIIADFIRDGGVVLVCPPCLRELGISSDGLVPGVQLAGPGVIQKYLFADNTRTLNW